ncbi:WecB/TagA/CpsF family glycosyltransferase [Candidatus Uhrbacteria bacterium]|jgi:N-acetylglucosaminyldiphosphoundecaprenol N-acetyl-beta-D-mannosaminyltransferase|nr:WecB/TagA/CpsF family glycosyltransferase [Candidatus Uhrbacteria bacterium]
MAREATFFDIPLNRFTDRSLEIRLEEALSGLSQTLIATPNPEMLMAARADNSIAQVLYRMHVRIPDGFGVSLMSVLTGQGKLRRFPGTDVLVDIARLASKKDMHMMIVGGWDDTSDRAKLILESAFPGIRVSHISDVSISYDGTWDQPESVLKQIADSQPDILAVALGSADYQKQERWIADFAPSFASVKIAIGIGGAIDMIAGKTKRAPKLMQSMGIEWLWRLIRQPARFKRIFTAVILFPIAVIQDTITSRK